MADRTVVVRIMAQHAQYQQAMAAMAGSTRGVDAAVTSLNRKTAASMKDMERQASRTGRSMTTAFAGMRNMVLGLGVPLAIGAIVKSFLDFERQMAHVKAVSDQFGRSATGMKLLRDSALEMGSAYGFSATEVGKAQEELAKAGRTTAQVLGGELNSALVLAAAGTIELDAAAKIIAVSMTQFKAEGITAAKVTDLLAQSANATVSDVTEMGTALSYVGPQAAAMGMSFEDTITTLSLFNQAGIQGDMAGTSLRGVLVGLTSPSKQAADEMRRLGINVYDAQGKFIGTSNLAQELQDKLEGLTEADKNAAIGRLATNATLPGFITLMKAGHDGVEKMRQEILKSATAEDVAKDKLNSLSGDLSKFGSAVEVAGIRTLSNLSPVLRTVTQGATDAAKAFSEMGGAAQLGLLALGGYLAFGRQRTQGAIGSLSGAVKGGAGGFGLARQAEIAAQRAADMARLASLGSASQMSVRDFQSRNAMFGAGAVIPPGHLASLKSHAAMLRQNADEMGGLAGTAGRFAGQFSVASGVIGKTGAALRGMAAAGKAAGSALLGVMGGWAGLAITGGLAAFTYFSSKSAEAKESAQNLKASLVQLGQEYATSGSTSSPIFADLVKKNADLRKLVDSSEKYGVAISDIGKAASGSAPHQAKILATYDKQLKTLKASKDLVKVGGTSMSTDQSGKANNLIELMQGKSLMGDSGGQKRLDKIKLLEDEKKTLDDVFKSAKANAIMDKALQSEVNAELEKRGVKVEEASVAQRLMMQNTMALAGAEVSFKDKLDAVQGSLDMLTSSYLAVADAQAAFYGGMKGELGDAFKNDKGAKVAPKVSAITGQFDFTDDAGAKQHAVVSKKAKEAADTVKKVWAETYAATNNNAQIAGTVAVAEFDRQRNALVGALAPLVGGTKKARELADAYLSVPDEIATHVNVEGMGEAIATARKLGYEIYALPQGKVAITSNTQAEATKLQGLGGKVTRMPNGKFRVTFDNQQQLLDALNQIAKPRTAPINVTAFNVDEANAAIDRAARARNATIGVHYAVDAQPRLPGSTYTGTNLDKSRWGNLYSYAAGGVQAKVAGPGTLVQWAEPETGGEAYIPRKGDPGRSKSILDVAAGWYGMKVSKMASGGITSFATGGINAPLSEMFSRYTSKAVTKDDFDAASKKRLDAIAALQKAERALNAVKANGKHTTRQLLDAESALAAKRRSVTAVTAAFNKASAGFAMGKKPKWEQFRGAMAMGVKNTNAFLWALKKLADRGYGQLASQLLAMGGPEAEQIAQGAMKASDSALKGTAYNVGLAVKQQKSLENYPAVLAVRSALKSGTSYGKLVGSGQVTAEALNSALALMEGELKKTSAGKAMLSAMGGANQAALNADLARFATGGIAAEGTAYRYAEQGTGGEAVIPRFGANGPAVLRKAAAWHGMSLSSGSPWDNVMQRAGGSSVQITVRGEGVLSGMIEATVDGRLVQVARAVRHGVS